MKNVFLSLVACLAIALIGKQTYGDVIIMVDDVTTTAGSPVSVGVWASAEDGESLSVINTPFDFGGDGAGIPAGLTYNGSTNVAGFDTLSPGTVPSTEEDSLVSGLRFGAPVDLSSPTLLYTLDFTVDGSVADGTVFNINILNKGTFTGALTSFNTLDENFTNVAGTPIDGFIRVNGIPEPGAAIVIVAGLIGFVSRRRR